MRARLNLGTQWTMIAFAVVLLAGCGGGGEVPLYNLSGDVTFDGNPVPYGRIQFEPDTAAGNVGGPGYAIIKDGHYDTSGTGGRGVIGGKHFVVVTGLDGEPTDTGTDEVAAAEQASSVTTLFREFNAGPADFAAEGSANYNVEVSAAEVKAVQERGTQGVRRGGPPDP